MTTIIKCGAATPVGRTSPVSVASARAGLSRLTKHPTLMDQAREPFTVGIANYINEFVDITDRFCRLTESALKDATEGIESLDSVSQSIPVILVLPEKRPGLSEELPELVSDAVAEHMKSLGLAFFIDCIQEGQAGAGEAIHRAQHMMAEKDIPIAIMGGIDCYFDFDTLKWLESNKRLFVSYYSDGFIPGEAAAFCVLASANSPFVAKCQNPTKITSVAISEEPRPHGSDSTSLGEGLSAAVTETLQNLEDHQQVDQIFYGMSGESFHALELGYALCRHGKRFNDIQNYVNWTRSWGDLGAASMFVSICNVVESAKKDYLRGPINMVLASSLGNKRAAAILESV